MRINKGNIPHDHLNGCKKACDKGQRDFTIKVLKELEIDGTQHNKDYTVAIMLKEEKWRSFPLKSGMSWVTAPPTLTQYCAQSLT